MAPFWRSLHVALAHQKPKTWTGYRCELEVGWDRVSSRFIVTAQFLDGVSNRAKTMDSRNVLDLIGCLHEAYRNFDVQLEWRKVTLTEGWDDEAKQWCQRAGWEYGRTVLEPNPGDSGLN